DHGWSRKVTNPPRVRHGIFERLLQRTSSHPDERVRGSSAARRAGRGCIVWAPLKSCGPMTAHSTNPAHAAHLARGGSPACGDSSARAGSPVDGRRAASGWTAWGWTASGWGKASRGQLLAILLLG